MLDIKITNIFYKYHVQTIKLIDIETDCILLYMDYLNFTCFSALKSSNLQIAFNNQGHFSGKPVSSEPTVKTKFLNLSYF